MPPQLDPRVVAHLERWVSIGLLESWEGTVPPKGASLWILRWTSGRVSRWRILEVKSAIVALHEAEQRSEASR